MRRREFGSRIGSFCGWFLLAGVCSALHADEDLSKTLATINGLAVTQKQLDLELLISGGRSPTEADRKAALDRVIDRTLVAQMLAGSQTDVLAEDVENLLQATRAAVESGDDTLEAVLGRLKLTEDDLRAAFRISVAWQAHVRKTVSDSQLRSYFEKQRPRFDGTEIRLRQIVRVLKTSASDSEWSAAEMKIADLRKQISADDLKFDSAAREFSQSPTAASGGDLGFVKSRGQVPAAVSLVAFGLKVGELSPPIRSAVGVHLVEVTEIRAGELSLEDARPELLRELGDELWRSTVKSLRAKAKIIVP